MRHLSGTQARLRPWHFLLCGVLLLPGLSGCATPTGTGAAAGGLMGAGAGALIGRSPGAALVGGVLGAGAGMIGGAAVEHSQNKAAARADAQARANVAARATSLEDVVHMTERNTPDSIIIDQIRNSGVVYSLTADNIIYLRDHGVSAQVISALQNTRPVVGYAAPPQQMVIVREPVYVAPPPPVVGIGIRGRF